MNIRIITDSGCDMLPPYAPNLTVLPLTITFGEESFLDGVELDHHRFYEKLIEGEELPTTSQIAPAAFEEAFQRAVDAGEAVVCVTLSSKLSGTYQSARIAAEGFAGQVWVVDSENVTIGQRLLVERAVELAGQGLDAAQLSARLDQEKKDIRLVALLDTLEYLKRGGRISPSIAMVGGLLSIKPVVAVENGEVVLLGKARGSKNGNNLLIQLIQKTSGVDFGRPYRLGYTGLDDGLLQKYIADSVQLWQDHVEELPVSTVGGAIGTHVGPGAVAVAFFRNFAGE